MTFPSFESPVRSNNLVSIICFIVSHFNLSDGDVYLLKNGFEKLSIGGFEGVNPENVQFYQTTVQNLSSNIYSAQGFYQCVLFTPRFMKREVKSQKQQIQFHGK